MDFAQDFAKEYLTYEKGGEQDFRTRINPYISQRLNNAPGIYAFRNNAKAAYVNAYRKEQEGKSIMCMSMLKYSTIRVRMGWNMRTVP